MKDPQGLAIDWLTKRIYLIEAEKNTIVTANLDGSGQVTIVSTGAHPFDIVVDPHARLVFWSTLDEGILSSSMDGSDKRQLLQGGVEWPTGLALDMPNRRVYWADQRKGTVETCLYNGKDRHVVKKFTNSSKFSVLLFNLNINTGVSIPATHPIRLDVFEDSLYVTLYDQTIERLNKYSGLHSKIILAEYTKTSDLVVVHPLKQVYNGNSELWQFSVGS